MRPQLSLAATPDIRFKSRTTTARSVRPPSGFDSDVLLCGAREVLIRHGGEVYRLRHTRNDKLILTK